RGPNLRFFTAVFPRPAYNRRLDEVGQESQGGAGMEAEHAVLSAQPNGISGREAVQSAVSVLLIDDDVELCTLMEKFFGRHGVGVEIVNDSSRGLARALAGEHDLVLLDVMMPGLDGLELLGQLRRRSQVPVIMLTARTAQADRVLGLNAGADDYLP